MKFVTVGFMVRMSGTINGIPFIFSSIFGTFEDW